MGDHLALPRLVPRDEMAERPPDLRLIRSPQLRRGARGHYVRHAPAPTDPADAVLVGPAPMTVAPVVSPPCREIRSLCCEGACSPGLQVFPTQQAKLLAVGYCRESTREAESAVLRHTPHYFVRVSSLAHTCFHTWACSVCGHERIYGAEEA